MDEATPALEQKINLKLTSLLLAEWTRHAGQLRLTTPSLVGLHHLELGHNMDISTKKNNNKKQAIVEQNVQLLL